MNSNITLLKEEFLKLKNEIGGLIEKVDTNQSSHLQNYIYFAHYPFFSFAESILILCENGKSHVAKVLLRSLFEAHIDIIYHQLGDSEHRLALSTKSLMDARAKNIRELRQLIQKYPNLESQDSTNLFNKEYLEKEVERIDEQRKAILRGNKSLKEKDKEPDLKKKSIQCDECTIKNAEKGHFERMYTVIYRLLSPTSHLNVEGLQTFVEQKITGEYLFCDGKDGDFVISEAIAICLAFTKDLYEIGVLKGEMPETASRIEKFLS